MCNSCRCSAAFLCFVMVFECIGVALEVFMVFVLGLGFRKSGAFTASDYGPRACM